MTFLWYCWENLKNMSKKLRENLTQILNEDLDKILKYLITKGEITERDRQMFLDYFIFYISPGDTKLILENHAIKESNIDSRMKEILLLVKKANENLLRKALHFESLERKFSELKFQNLQRNVYSDALFTNMRDARFLQKLNIKTVLDLLTKELNPKQTKEAQKGNVRLIRITQEIVDKLGF
jgi:hypothetical protein